MSVIIEKIEAREAKHLIHNLDEYLKDTISSRQ